MKSRLPLLLATILPYIENNSLSKKLIQKQWESWDRMGIFMLIESLV
jgi:hypothetical protein